MQFWKMEGCGNDFVVVDALLKSESEWIELAPRLNDRHFGVGGDGLMAIGSERDGEFPVLMLNPDGSYMGMCGNGIRCVTRFLYLTRRVQPDVREIRCRVGNRLVVCRSSDQGRNVSVNLGVPSFSPAEIPVVSAAEVLEQPLEVCGREFEISCVSMGNPHCVIFVDSLKEVDLERWGAALERHERFPKRTNVEFVEVRSPEHLAVLVWERGAGVTLACGTGACASLAIAQVLGKAGERATVSLTGGDLVIAWQGRGTPVTLTGPAREVFQGEW